MSGDFEQFLELQKATLAAEKKRLELICKPEVQVRKQLKECMLV